MKDLKSLSGAIFQHGEAEYRLTIEQAEYAKSDAPKLTPSKTKANALIG